MNSIEKLSNALLHDNIALCIEAINEGVDIHYLFGKFIIAASQHNSVEIVELLLNHGADVHAGCEAPLRYSALKGRFDVVKLLVERGADIHDKYDTVLTNAAQCGSLEIIEYLVEKGCNIEFLKYSPNEEVQAWYKSKKLSEKLNANLKEKSFIKQKKL